MRWRRLSPEAARVEVLNPSDGGFWFWLFKFYAFAVLCLGGLGLLGGIGLYAYFASTLPALPDFDRYRLETAESTRVRAWDGTDLAELASERREILPLEAFPKTLHGCSRHGECSHCLMSFRSMRAVLPLDVFLC